MLPLITVHASLNGFRSVGLDADSFARAVGVPLDGDHDPFATVPPEVFGRLWALAFEHDPRPHLPVLVGSAIPFGAFGLLDYLVGSARTLGDGMAALARYFRLAAMTVRLELSEKPTTGVWIRNVPPMPGDIVSDAFTLAVIASRFGTRATHSAPREVHLTQPEGPAVEPFERVFGCPVYLGRPRSGLVYHPQTWMRRLASADEHLHATLLELAKRNDVRRYVGGPLSYAIRLQLPERLRTGNATIGHFANSLNLSLRTLQRRLANESVRFETLVDDFRRTESVRLLDDPARSITDVAADLGYRELGSFSRAFRRWHGTTPSKWRRQRAG